DQAGLRAYAVHLDDGIRWYTQLRRSRADRGCTRRFIQAVGLSLVSAEEREQPLYADLVIHLFDRGHGLRISRHEVGKRPLYEKQGHGRSLHSGVASAGNTLRRNGQFTAGGQFRWTTARAGNPAWGARTGMPRGRPYRHARWRTGHREDAPCTGTGGAC